MQALSIKNGISVLTEWFEQPVSTESSNVVLIAILYLISYTVTKVWVLILNGTRTSGIVDNGQIRVSFSGGESHQPPSVVRSHVETECSREVACGSIMEAYKRFSESACVRIGEAFSPELDSSLEPYLVFESASGSVS